MKRVGLLFIPTILVVTLNGCVSIKGDHDFYVVSHAKKTTFNVGEAFTTDGLVLANKDKLSETITDYTTSIAVGYVFTVNDLSIKSVTISKAGFKDYSYSITVTNLDALEITSMPKTEFIVNEYFSIDGLVVTCKGQEVTGYTVSLPTSNRLTQIGPQTVEISKEGYQSAFYDIYVYPERALHVQALPNKTVFDEGEAFDATGLVIIDERDNEVSDYELSLPQGTILKGSGNRTIEVSKVGYPSTSFTIKVNEGTGPTVNHSLKIYYLNDTHGTYTRQQKNYEGGMAYLSSYIKTQVAKDPDYSIVLSGGDMFQGGYESNETGGSIMVDAMNEISFDAMVVGNHEFDWGESAILNIYDQLECPMISSNIFYSDQETRPTWLTPYVILDKGDLRVGIIGGAQENLGSSITGSISDNFYFPNPNGYIQSYSTILRNSHGCDVVIAAFHDGGFSGSSGSPTKFDILTSINPETGYKYVDAMFFAHDHIAKRGDYNGVPYLEAGCNGKYVGSMTLNLEGNGTSYTVESYSTYNTYGYSSCTTYDSAFDVIETKYAAIIAKGNEIVYKFANAYTSDEFTLVACEAMYWYVNSHKEEFDNTTVSMSSHNSGGVRADIDAGELYLRDFVKAFPFDNYLSIQTCNRQNINRYLSYDYYVTYGDAVFDDQDHAKVASINYITEKSNAYLYQIDYKNYDVTVKHILYTFLKENINPNL